MVNGARNALLGYLYQLSETASLRTCSLGEHAAGTGQADLVIEADRGTITSELFNQDAVFVPDTGTGCVAIQMKYSADPPDPINLRDFVELLFGFDRSRELAERQGKDFDRYFVVTNRRPDTQVLSLWGQRQVQDLLLSLLSRRREHRWPEWLQQHFRHYQNEGAAVTAWGAVLQKLADPVVAPYEHGFQRLKDFARRHGVLAPELEQALDNLFGNLFRRSAGAGPEPITAALLKSHLVGAPDAREVAFGAGDGILFAAREQLEQRRSDIAGPSKRAVIRRRLALELVDQVQRHSVTFICGDGGSGKSMLAVQHLLDAEHGPVGLSLRATDATETFLLDSLRRLRSPDHGHNLPRDTLVDAIGRIKAANPSESGLVGR